MANLQYLLDNDLQGNALRVGSYLLERLRPLADRYATVAEVRGRGLMIGIELVEEDGRTPSPRRAAACLEACKAEGVLLGKGGLYGNCLRVAPPLSHHPRRGRRGRGGHRRRAHAAFRGGEG